MGVRLSNAHVLALCRLNKGTGVLINVTGITIKVSVCICMFDVHFTFDMYIKFFYQPTVWEQCNASNHVDRAEQLQAMLTLSSVIFTMALLLVSNE